MFRFTWSVAPGKRESLVLAFRGHLESVCSSGDGSRWVSEAVEDNVTYFLVFCWNYLRLSLSVEGSGIKIV